MVIAVLSLSDSVPVPPFLRFRCVLAGGLTPSDVSAIRAVIDEEEGGGGGGGDGETPLVLYTSDLSEKTLGDVLGDAENICRRQVIDSSIPK